MNSVSFILFIEFSISLFGKMKQFINEFENMKNNTIAIFDIMNQ